MGTYFLIIHLTLISFIIGSEDIKLRLNYGTFFENAGKITFSSSHWIHGFAVDILNTEQLTQIKNYSKSLNDNYAQHVRELSKHSPGTTAAIHYYTKEPYEKLTNGKFQDFLQYTERNAFFIIFEELQSLINAYEHYIQSVIEYFPDTKARLERSFLDISGLTKSVFGLASDQDVQKLQKGFKQINHAFTNYETKSHNVISNLTSMTSLVNERVSGLTQTYRSLNITVEKLKLDQKQFQGINNNLMRTAASLDSTLRASNVLSDIKYDVERITLNRLALSELQSGKLSSFLIEPAELQNTLDKISEYLRTTHSSYKLLFESAEQIYSNPKFMLARNNDSLIITLLFPLEPKHHDLQLYEVTNLPLHIQSNDTKNFYSILKDTPDYYIHDFITDMFQILPRTKLNQCNKLGRPDNVIYDCDYNFRLKTRRQPNCINALFRGNTKDIKNQCKFSIIQPLDITSEIIPLHDNNYIIKDTESLTIACDSTQSRTIEGCLFCMLKITSTCDCKLIDNFNVVQSTQEDCSPYKAKVTKLFTANIIAIETFKPERSEIPTILPNQLFPSTYSDNIEYPSLNQIIKTFPEGSVIQHDQQLQVDIDKLKSNIKNGLDSYQSLADKNLHYSVHYDATNAFNGWPNIVLWVIVITLILVTGYHQYRLIIYSKILSVLPTIHATNIYELRPACTPTETALMYQTLIEHCTTLVYTISAIIIFFILLKLMQVIIRNHIDNHFFKFLFSNILQVKTHITLLLHDKNNKIPLYLGKINGTIVNLALSQRYKIIGISYTTIMPGLLYKVCITFDNLLQLHDDAMIFRVGNTAYISSTNKTKLENMQNGSVGTLYAQANHYIIRISNTSDIIMETQQVPTFSQLHQIFDPHNHPATYDESREHQPLPLREQVRPFTGSVESM